MTHTVRDLVFEDADVAVLLAEDEGELAAHDARSRLGWINREAESIRFVERDDVLRVDIARHRTTAKGRLVGAELPALSVVARVRRARLRYFEDRVEREIPDPGSGAGRAPLLRPGFVLDLRLGAVVVDELPGVLRFDFPVEEVLAVSTDLGRPR